MLQTEDDKFVFMTYPETAEGVFSGQVLESTSTSKTRTCDRKELDILFKACKDGTKRIKLKSCLNNSSDSFTY